MHKFTKPVSAYVYMVNKDIGAGEALMGADLAEVIYKTMECKTMESLSKWGHITMVDISVCQVKRETGAPW